MTTEATALTTDVEPKGDEEPTNPDGEKPKTDEAPKQAELPIGTPTTPTEPAKPNTPAPPAPEELDIKVPAGMEADKAIVEEFKPLAKELGLKSDGAQKLVDFYAKAASSWTKQAASQWEETNKEWVQVSKSDKLVGGEKFDANLVTARKAVSVFGDPELTDLFEKLHVGNHPALIRFCYRVGKRLGEDTVAGTTASPSEQTQTSEEAVQRVLYPSMFKQQG